MLSEKKREFEAMAARIEELGFLFDVAGREQQIKALEEQTAASGFWDDPAAAQKTMQKITALKNRVELYLDVKRHFEDLKALWELGLEEGDESLEGEIDLGLADMVNRLDRLQLDLMLSGPYDRGSAIISLHAGAGGTEAQDWVQMLLRMYTRWAEEKGYRVATIDLLPGDEAGVKSVTLSIEGENAYGYLKTEKGVHRLVRISPFDASGRRHTSFASVDVMPEVDDENEISIDPADLRVDTYRSGGAGGQHVNKTDSAVRITHIPTGIVVQCQNERSQLANRLQAMKLLQARLLDLQLRKREEELAVLRGDQQEIAWGSQIRSYVFHPYSLVKDHRTGVEMGNVTAVMDGDIDQFISSYLRQHSIHG
ncbi:MAG: peptide chain release factor 2 [Bacillota bacterium]